MKKIMCLLFIALGCGASEQGDVKRHAHDARIAIEHTYNELARDPIAHEADIKTLLSNAAQSRFVRVSFWAKKQLYEFEARLADAKKKVGPVVKPVSAAAGKKLSYRGQSEQIRLDKALEQAVIAGDIGLARALIDQGADVNLRLPPADRTPLIEAVIVENLDMVSMLLEKKAIIDLVDLYRQSALDHLTMKTNYELWQLILNYYKNPSLVITLRNLPSDTEPEASLAIIDLVLHAAGDKAARIINKPQDGELPLLAAAYLGWVAAVKLLIDNGAAIDAQNSYGYTALMVAIKAGESNLVQYLLQQRANPFISDNSGNNAFDYARVASAEIKTLVQEFYGNYDAYMRELAKQKIPEADGKLLEAQLTPEQMQEQEIVKIPACARGILAECLVGQAPKKEDAHVAEQEE